MKTLPLSEVKMKLSGLVDSVSSTAELIPSLHPSLKKKIKSSFQTILSDPFSGKALKEELIGLRSFRADFISLVFFQILTG